MRSFEAQGLIRRRQGVGTFVVGPKAVIETGLEVLESIETQAKRIGLDVSMGTLSIQKMDADLTPCGTVTGIGWGTDCADFPNDIRRGQTGCLPGGYAAGGIFGTGRFAPGFYGFRIGSSLAAALRNWKHRWQICTITAPSEIARSLKFSGGCITPAPVPFV